MYILFFELFLWNSMASSQHLMRKTQTLLEGGGADAQTADLMLALLLLLLGSVHYTLSTVSVGFLACPPKSCWCLLSACCIFSNEDHSASLQSWKLLKRVGMENNQRLTRKNAREIVRIGLPDQFSEYHCQRFQTWCKNLVLVVSGCSFWSIELEMSSFIPH